MTRDIPTIRDVLTAGGFALMATGAFVGWMAVPPTEAQQGEIIDGTKIIDNAEMIPFDQAFFAFEVESPLQSLKEVLNWDEIEQMLDNPYQYALDPTVRGNDQGWPSYRLTQPRRQSFNCGAALSSSATPLTSHAPRVPRAAPKYLCRALSFIR
jgi:hypothetical protein